MISNPNFSAWTSRLTGPTLQSPSFHKANLLSSSSRIGCPASSQAWPSPLLNRLLLYFLLIVAKYT